MQLERPYHDLGNPPPQRLHRGQVVASPELDAWACAAAIVAMDHG